MKNNGRDSFGSDEYDERMDELVELLRLFEGQDVVVDEVNGFSGLVFFNDFDICCDDKTVIFGSNTLEFERYLKYKDIDDYYIDDLGEELDIILKNGQELVICEV